MLMLTVILLVIVADNIDAACSMPARKLAAAVVEAMAAASNIRLIVKPLLDVAATTEPGPPEPFWAACASTDSAGRVGVGEAIGFGGGRKPKGLPPPWSAAG